MVSKMLMLAQSYNRQMPTYHYGMTGKYKILTNVFRMAIVKVKATLD